MSDILLSFCIPTYNRAEIVYQNVLNILACPDTDIEVVVHDNGSTDSTMNLLATICDKRLSVYTNGINKGVLFNILNALDKGQGKYLIFSTDKDSFKKDSISKFKSFLQSQSQLAAGFCEYNSVETFEHEKFLKGFSAVNAIAYMAKHPTGYFFNNRLLKSINLIERFSDHGMVDTFPFDFMFAEMCLLGDGYIYHPDLVTPETGGMAAKIKSFGTDGRKKDAFFSPESRLRMAINFSQHIATLNLSQKEKNWLIIGVFMRGLGGATFGYRKILRNLDLCEHYGMASRNVPNVEIMKYAISYVSSFIKKTVSIWGNSFFEKIAFFINVIIYIAKKIFIKARKRFK